MGGVQRGACPPLDLNVQPFHVPGECSRHEQIKVRLDSAEPAPARHTELNQLEWKLTLDKRERKTIRFAFSVEAPRTMPERASSGRSTPPRGERRGVRKSTGVENPATGGSHGSVQRSGQGQVLQI